MNRRFRQNRELRKKRREEMRERRDHLISGIKVRRPKTAREFLKRNAEEMRQMKRDVRWKALREEWCGWLYALGVVVGICLLLWWWSGH